MKRQSIGLDDRDGRPIMTGDLVRFFFHPETGATDEQQHEHTRMVDVVIIEMGVPYFMSELGGARAERYNKVCKVVGRLPEDAEMFVDALAFPPKSPELRATLIARVNELFPIEEDPAK